MEWSWLESLLYGFISGFFEFLPVSSDSHKGLYVFFSGAGAEESVFRLISHISVLLALLILCRPHIVRLYRERKIASIPAGRRKRQPDSRSLLDMRVLRTAWIPLLLCFLFYLPVKKMAGNMGALAFLFAANGMILYLPQLFPRGNKDSRSASAIDSLVLGLGAGLGVIPGISRMGAALSFGKIRGLDRQYALDISLLLSLPSILILVGFDVYSIVILGAAVSIGQIIAYILTAAAAFLGAYSSITLMRFLAVKVGFSGFSYYCWGAALFTFILYLTIS